MPLYGTLKSTGQRIIIPEEHCIKWEPSEWRERDLTKDTKKQNLPYEKRVATLDRWFAETMRGKYKKERLKILGLSEAKVYATLKSKLKDNKPVRVPTSPVIRVGVEKDLCPNLVELGDKVAFAKDFADYLTYKHRKSSIAGGDIEEMDFDEEAPNTGYLSMYREQDGRIPTPAIEIGAACVTKDSELITFKGVKKIVEIELGDEVLTHDGVYGKVVDFIDNGIKPVYRITTETGLTLKCTDNHPFMTVEEGWVRLKNLDKEKHTLLTYGNKEVWSLHPLFPQYKVSSLGKVLNKHGLELKPLVSKDGLAYTLDLYDGKGNKCRRSVGKLVCETFNGLCPDGLEVRHLDGNTSNNNIKNLKFGTSKENSDDANKHRYTMKKRRATVEKISDEDVINIRKHFNSLEYKKGDDETIAAKYGVSRKYINEIRRGIRRIIIEPYKEEFEKCKILSIEYCGEEPTYDITVGNQHSYVVNGIVTHNTNRYKHIGVANIPRATSIYGKEMRSLFGCGEGYVQLGFDFASLEARVEGSFCYNGTDGEAYATSLIAEKPNDVHTVNSIKLGIERSSVKAFKYALTYGCSVGKVMKMLSKSKEEAEDLFDNFWNAAPSLKELKDEIEREWLQTGKKYIRGVDGRKINIRSQHSILNALFQSTGVIAAKYSLVYTMQDLESQGYCIDCFKGKPDIAEMISYHDEGQLAVNKQLVKYKTFTDEEEAKAFVSNWTGKQISAVSHGKKWYVALPNPISIAIGEGIEKATKTLELNVPLGYEWIVSNTWYGCH